MAAPQRATMPRAMMKKEINLKLSMEPAVVTSPSVYTTLTKDCALRKQMMLLFNRTCYNYVNGRACRVSCKWNHKLPPVHEIYPKLMRFSTYTVMYMYSNFIVKSKMAFFTYFSTMCDIFGSRKMESSLMNAIKDCEQYGNFVFYKYIYNGLILTGLSKRDALSQVVDCCRKSRSSYDVVLEIIVESDPLCFIDILKQYYRHATVNHYHMYKLLQQVTITPVPALLTVFVDILDNAIKPSMYDICDVESFKFILLGAKGLVEGDVVLSSRLSDIASRFQ